MRKKHHRSSKKVPRKQQTTKGMRGWRISNVKRKKGRGHLCVGEGARDSAQSKISSEEERGTFDYGNMGVRL